jgi:heme A synthase
MRGGLAYFHGFGARVLVLFAVLLGLWGAYYYFRNRPLSGGFRSTYLIMAGLVPVQGILGVAALIAGGSAREGILHMVYGVFAVLFVPGAYLYTRGHDTRREALYLAGASWIVAIAFFRGISTG